MAPRHAVTAFFCVSLGLLCATFRERGLNDPGTLWHTRVGQILLDRGFMTTDPFTFTFEGKTWIPQQWFGEVVMAKLHEAGILSMGPEIRVEKNRT